MSWNDDNIAGPMGYKYCVLFDCARNAISTYHDIVPYKPIGLPENICPELVSHMRSKGFPVIFGDIDQTTGLAKGAVHLYGYQAPYAVADLAIDPLMTGWLRQLKNPSAVISFGRKKMLSLSYGGALLTNDQSLAKEAEPLAHWNNYYTEPLRNGLHHFHDFILKRFEAIHLWDRFLGDSLIRIPGEQIMPWRVMRRAESFTERRAIVYELRKAGIDVGTNYPPLTGSNRWGETVLNFFCSLNLARAEIYEASELVKRVVNDG